MLTDVLVLLVSLVVILFAAELFTNGIEWMGRKLGLGEGAVGSVLAAVGTALPETLIPIIAIVFATAEGSHAVWIQFHEYCRGAPLHMARDLIKALR